MFILLGDSSHSNGQTQIKKTQHEHSKCFIPRSKSLKHTPNKHQEQTGKFIT